MHVTVAARHAQVRKLVLWSQTWLYGAHPINPNFLTESHPLRASTREPYFADKIEAEDQARRLAQRAPGTVVTVLAYGAHPGPHGSQLLHELPRAKARAHHDGLRSAGAVHPRGRRHRRASPGHPARRARHLQRRRRRGAPAVDGHQAGRPRGRARPPPDRRDASPPPAGSRRSPMLRPRSSSTCASSAWPTGSSPVSSSASRPAYTSREALLDFVSAQHLRDVKLLSETPA